MEILVNKVLYDEKLNCLITNEVIEPKEHFRFSYDLEYMKELKKKYPNTSFKDIFRKKFRQQQLCKDYQYRNYIWTFSNLHETATIYCLIDKERVLWNYQKNSDINEVIKLKQEIETIILSEEEIFYSKHKLEKAKEKIPKKAKEKIQEKPKEKRRK